MEEKNDQSVLETSSEKVLSTSPQIGEKAVKSIPFSVRTMEGDKAEAKIHPSSSEETVNKPFSEFIPPPPTPDKKDAYRESVNDVPVARDQHFSFPESPSPIPSPSATDQDTFHISIPQETGLPKSTIILISVLVLLLIIGVFGYWWFFIKESASLEDQSSAEVIEEPELVIPDVVTPTPELEPEPEPEPELEPLPDQAPISEPEPIVTSDPTSTPEPTPVVVIAESEKRESVIALDELVVIEIASLDQAAFLEKLQIENAKIKKQNTSIQYRVKLSSPTEKRFLSFVETMQLLNVSIPPALLNVLGTSSDFIGYRNADGFRYGFISSVTDQEKVKKEALSWETMAIADLKGLYIQKAYAVPTRPVFSSNTYLAFWKRYINLPTHDVSFDWAVSPRYFVVGTSKEMIFTILDKTQK